MAKNTEVRRFFRDVDEIISEPDLIAIQKDSYEWFVKDGLRELFEEVSPIKDFIGRDLELFFVEHYLDEPKFDEMTSREKNLNFEAPLRVKARLVNKRTGEIKEQEIFMGDLPLMTDRGTFVINGVERVVISQLIRSAGVFFMFNMHSGRRHYGARIIPNRGAWIEIETDQNHVIWAKVDRKRKVAITSLLRAFGYETDDQIRELFSDVEVHPEINSIENTLLKDASSTVEEGLTEVYKRLRPGDLPNVDSARSLINNMFFNFDRYDLGPVGRYKINQKFGQDQPINQDTRVLTKDDLIMVIKEIISLNYSQKAADDIDHLGNRRVRTVGELVQNRFRVGVARMERIIKDRMSTYDIETTTPNKLVNARPLIGVVKEFFMSHQLSQFMDQINPLSELEHKRRLSALGPGGLSRDRAGFEVRDVHTTHYGRICPIETPEGPNIGLVGHLATYARINEYGFVETPFRKVVTSVPAKAKQLEGEIVRGDVEDTKGKVVAKDGTKIDAAVAKKLEASGLDEIPVKPRVTDQFEYLSAFVEEKQITTPATSPVDENGHFIAERVEARMYGVPGIVPVERINYMDISSRQIISVATSLIPFVEHDDANRALMGSNMQRQAVPVVKPQAPTVGTGVEALAARNSGQVVIAEEDGEVTAISGDSIEITYTKARKKVYPLRKFLRSNAGTCINQRITGSVGQKVKKGDVVVDGAAMENGELALGQNLLVAFMAYEGGNFEDAILISERVVQKDRYTSIHIETYPIDIRDTKLGPEVITSDIPNISEEKLKNLDEEGIIRIGAEVSSGDILVGKITPKGETELSPEEKLLRVIFGEKAKDVRDSSLYLEHGEHGKVIDVKVFSREAGDKLPSGVIKSVHVSVAQLRKLQVGDKMAGRHGNKGVVSRIVNVEDMPHMQDGTPVDIVLSPLGVVSRMNLGQILETHLGLAARHLGYTVATPAFNGVTEKQIKEELQKANYPASGQIRLRDGRTGEFFDNPTTVGVIYMLKLGHLVEDKIHQRSIGPYSLVTQQPLGGKAQFGGQRFGEMEVWALEAYGAAYALQEILTIKSDDVPGRAKAYESIIKGEKIRTVNVPESFNVLVRELKGLCLDVELLDDDNSVINFEARDAHTHKKK